RSPSTPRKVRSAHARRTAAKSSQGRSRSRSGAGAGGTDEEDSRTAVRESSCVLLTRCESSRGVSHAFGGSAAGELLTQSRERLIAGERARIRLSGGLAGVGRRSGLRADRGGGGGVRIGRDGLRDLLLVLFPVVLGLSVLLLPLLALRLEALEPLVGLRVEALRALAVPVLVA